MNIRLRRLMIENFKGIKTFEVDFDGEDVAIKGENGSGKTTVYDAFLWLLFGKDSSGRKDFELRPLDGDNQPMKGLVLSVQGEIDIDGTHHNFRKEHHEKVVKKQLRGYETLCWIDEVPKKVGEYAEYITNIVPEDTFKLLTDLHFFTSKMHWTDRRAVLLEVAGEIDTPEGFEELIAALNGRTVDEYKQILAEQKKRFVKEHEEINPRIDEIQRGLDEYAGSDTSQLDTQRQAVKKEISGLDARRQKLFAKEKERQTRIDQLNNLKSKKMQRESELANNTSGIKDLLNEQAEIEKRVADKNVQMTLAEGQIRLCSATITSKKSELESHHRSLQATRSEYESLQGSPVKDTCKLCGQPLPSGKIEAIEAKRKVDLEAITRQGSEQKKAVTACQSEIARLEAKLAEKNELLSKAKNEYHIANNAAEKRATEIDAAVIANKGTPPEQDETWKAICAQIAEAEKAIGVPVSEQLEEVESQKTAKANELAELDKALAQADRMAKDKARIAELEAKEKELAQSIADVERQLHSIDEYTATESRLIEEAVNGKFKYVEFKLFNQLLNGGLEECCEATLNGVPYSDMSYGQRVIVGIDIINVLSAHNALSVPLFIDNSESLTLPIESTSQTIQLCAEKNAKKLEINIQKREKVVT